MTRTTIVTAIGSFSADCVINTLHALGRKVIGTDIYPGDWHYETSLCDDFFQAPYATDRERYIDFLLETASSTGADSLLPLTDLEIDVIAPCRDRFAEKGIKLYMQPDEVLEVARDKYRLYLRFKDSPLFGVPASFATPCPAAGLVSSLPLVAKPRDGRSSEGLTVIRSESELHIMAGKENYILQEFREGPIFTVDYVRDSFGNDAAIARKELIRTKNGAGLTVEIVPDPVFTEMTSLVGSELGVTGCVNMEFILSDGRYYLIDINPRFSAGVAFSSLAGYDMAAAGIAACDGARIPEAVIPRKSIMQKRHVEVVNRIL